MEFSFLLICSQCGNIVQKISLFEAKKSDRQSRHKMKLQDFCSLNFAKITKFDSPHSRDEEKS